MAGLLIDWKKGVAIQKAVGLLPEGYRETHILSRVNVRGDNPLKASVRFSPECSFCDSPVRISLEIAWETSQDSCNYFKAWVTSCRIAVGPLARVNE
jgi:hypothetical protein